MIRLLLPAAIAATLTLTAAGCVPDPDGRGADIVTTTTTTAPADGNGDGAPGTRQNPVPAGTTVNIGDWEITLGPTDTDAAAAVAAGSVLEQTPPDGHRFVLVRVDVTYVGEDSGNPLFDISIKYLGPGGNTFTRTSGGGPIIGPEPLSRVGEMFPGATGAGDVVVSVPEDQVNGGAWIVQSGGADRTFYALS